MSRLILAVISAVGGSGEGMLISAGRVLVGAFISCADGVVTVVAWVVGGGGDLD